MQSILFKLNFISLESNNR